MSEHGFARADGDRRFQLLLETLPHIAFVIEPGGHASYYNQVFIDYLGFRPGSDTASRTVLQHPDDRGSLEAARQAGVAASSEYIVEARLLRHDGVYRWHRIHNKPLIRDGRPIGWLGTAVDIHDIRQANEVLEQRVRERTAELEVANKRLTAEILQRQATENVLRDSEERHRTLYNRTPIALHSVDANARLLDVNETWLSMFGYQREDVIGRSPIDFMTQESAERYRQQSWPDMLAGPGGARVVDYQFLTRSGETFDGRLAARGEFDAEGRFIRSWSAVADVTAEKRAAQDLRQAQRLEAIGQLTAGIAHDFNNLLTAILANLELLTKRFMHGNAGAAKLVAGARTAAERGAKLTAQLLAFSRQQRIKAEPVDLNQVVQGMLPLLQSTIGTAAQIDIVAQHGLWTALGDPTQLELALLNLAINARDAMPQGGTITITTGNMSHHRAVRPEEPAPGNYACVSVSDTGSGITDEVRERIFEPFFTTKEVGKGSGLGLPQVLGVAKQLGGGITVSSTPGAGTCVTIFLPQAKETAAALRETSPEANTMEAVQARRASILLVDDDADVRKIAAEILRDAGHHVVEAASGAAALEILNDDSTWAEVLVIDIVMPGMNGVELAKIARHRLPAVPVLFMTGYADAGLLPLDTTDDVLKKPFQAWELETKVMQAAGRTRVNRKLP